MGQAEILPPARRMIFLPALERRVTIRQYIQAIQKAKASPDLEFKSGLDSWWPTTGAEIMRQFRHAVHDRITQAIPYMERGKDEKRNRETC